MEGYDLTGRTLLEGLDVAELRHQATGRIFHVYAFPPERLRDYEALCAQVASVPRHLSKVVSMTRDSEAAYIMTEALPPGTGVRSWVRGLVASAGAARTETPAAGLYRIAVEMHARRNSPEFHTWNADATTAPPEVPVPDPPSAWASVSEATTATAQSSAPLPDDITYIYRPASAPPVAAPAPATVNPLPDANTIVYSPAACASAEKPLAPPPVPELPAPDEQRTWLFGSDKPAALPTPPGPDATLLFGQSLSSAPPPPENSEPGPSKRGWWGSGKSKDR